MGGISRTIMDFLRGLYIVGLKKPATFILTKHQKNFSIDGIDFISHGIFYDLIMVISFDFCKHNKITETYDTAYPSTSY